MDGKLDHEKNSSHTVTLTADDGSGTSSSSDTITVTIYVTDADEAPVIKDRAYPTAQGTRTVSYAENGTGNVASFTATDPEGATPLTWALTAAAVANVTGDDIADRARFNLDQNGVLTWEASPSYETNSVSGDKNYQVVVQASDGNLTSYFEVTVAVTNVEESGKITWTTNPPGDGLAGGLQQFQPGATLTATLTDPDGTATVSSWKWYRGSTLISGSTGNTHAVTTTDVGNRIRVTATYSDGSGPAESASLTSANPVQGTHQANTGPTFGSATTTRRVDENSKSGNVGGVVTATDAQGDKLTYAFTEAETNFDINPGTGQITVKSTASLNYENATSDTVEVTAYDSSGTVSSQNITVTVNVGNVDEKPAFTAGAQAPVIQENADTLTLGAAHAANDPEGKEVTLSLVGNDANLFELGNDTADGNAVAKVLSFKKSPDFEMPGDRNRDNLYEVTVRASDGTLTADQMVVVKVTDLNTEVGKVTLSSEEAVIGVELTATITDTENGVSASGQITGENWSWHKATDAGFTPGEGNDIEGATSSTYTPVRADSANYLKARVTYTYQYGSTTKTSVSDAVQVRASRTNQAPKFRNGESTFRVVAENTAANTADDASGATNVTTDDVGSPVVADDANGDTVGYTLGGDDAALFRVSPTGQIEVKGTPPDYETNSSHTVTLTANDGSGSSNATAMITVTIYVTDEDEKPEIMVGGIAVSGAGSPSFAENGTGAVATYTASGPNAATATWSLEGDDSSRFMLDGSGANRMLKFTSAPNYEMPRGQAMSDTNTNTYMVTVKVVDGTFNNTQSVTVTVTDANDLGTVTLSQATPRAGTAIMATLADEDASADDIAGATWQWAKSTANDSGFEDIDGATSASYTPVDADEGNYLRATATYNDRHNTGDDTTTASKVSDNTVAPGDPVLVKFDGNNNGVIDKDEVIAAITRFFNDPTDVSRAEVIDLIGRYFDDLSGS